MADGTVTSPWLDAAGKDTAGYRLDRLLVGSEGTLGIVTAARLRLVRPTPPTATLLLGLATADAIADAVADVRRVVDGTATQLLACEFVTADGLALVAAARTGPTDRRPSWRSTTPTAGGCGRCANVTPRRSTGWDHP